MATPGLTNILRQIDADIASRKSAFVPDHRFDEIASALLQTVQDGEWVSRPRTWFILNRIGRLDTMPAFIAMGLNDASFPYSGRKSLPTALAIDQVHEIERIQDLVNSDMVQLEKGKHVSARDGDQFFDGPRYKLGVGGHG